MSPRSVEGDHELCEQSLAERIRVYQPLDLGDDVTAGSRRELCIDSILERVEAPLLEMRYLRTREGLEGEIGERRAPPERKRLVDLLDDSIRIRCRTGVGKSILETIEITLARRDF